MNTMIGCIGNYSGKRVFVTGHTGFKGSWLCEMLLMAGAEVSVSWLWGIKLY